MSTAFAAATVAITALGAAGMAAMLGFLGLLLGARWPFGRALHTARSARYGRFPKRPE